MKIIPGEDSGIVGRRSGLVECSLPQGGVSGTGPIFGQCALNAKVLAATLLDLLQDGGIYALLEQEEIIEPQT